MKILFLSRAFPPILGGIEKQNADLSLWLSKHAEVRVIANRRGKRFLPLFLPRALLQCLFVLPRYDVLLLGDGVLAPLGFFLKCLYPGKVVVSIVHGLDLTYSGKKGLLSQLYKGLNIPSLKGLDGLICVSEETKRVALDLGMAPERAFVIPNGVDPADIREPHTRDELDALLGVETIRKKIIVRIGRFVRHKGVEWFIRHVVPELPEDVLFVAAGGVATHAVPGDANIYPECVAAVKELGLESRVRLLTNVPWQTVKILLNTADLAVAPNIPVPGSMEGFGISVIEASMCGVPIIVSRLEGLQEAVKDGENGLFVEPGNAREYQVRIRELLEDADARRELGQKFQAYSEAHFHWAVISLKYMHLLARLRESVRSLK